MGCLSCLSFEIFEHVVVEKGRMALPNIATLSLWVTHQMFVCGPVATSCFDPVLAIEAKIEILNKDTTRDLHSALNLPANPIERLEGRVGHSWLPKVQ